MNTLLKFALSFYNLRSAIMTPPYPPPAPPPSAARVLELFHNQIRQHGPDLTSFITSQLGHPPPGLSITLDSIQLPGFPTSWVWFVGSPDSDVERAVLDFFKSDAGTRALNTTEGVEFKLASTRLQLPPPNRGPGEEVWLPRGFVPAVSPLQEGQEVLAIPFSFKQRDIYHGHSCLATSTGAWLQVFPKTELEPYLLVQVRQDDWTGELQFLFP
jgi:hypothetical protein